MKTTSLTNKMAVMAIIFSFIIMSACSSSSQQKEEKTEESPEMTGMITYGTDSEQAIKAYNSAMDHFFLGDRKKARDKFDEALKADPNFAMATVYRGFTSRSAKEFAEHGAKLLTLRENASEAEQIMIDLYQSLLKSDMETRMSLATKLSQNYPNDPMAQYELINVYGAMDMQDKARAHMEAMIKQHPETAFMNMRVALSYMFDEPKDLDKATMYANKAVALKPDMPRPHIILGDSYRAKNDLEHALSSYEKAVALDPKNPESHNKKGHANTFLGNYDAARADFAAAKEVSDVPMGAVIPSAATYVYEGNHEKALELMDAEAASLAESDLPEDIKRVRASSCAYSCSMIALYDRDGKKLTNYVEKLNELSDKIAEDIGTEEAVTLNKADNMLWEARLAMVKGDFKTAVDKANAFKSMTASFTNPGLMKDYHLTMGMIAMDQKDATTAIEHLKQTDSGDVFSQFHLAKAYEMNGQQEEANKLYASWKDYNFNDISYALVRNVIQEKAS